MLSRLAGHVAIMEYGHQGAMSYGLLSGLEREMLYTVSSGGPVASRHSDTVTDGDLMLWALDGCLM